MRAIFHTNNIFFLTTLGSSMARKLCHICLFGVLLLLAPCSLAFSIVRKVLPGVWKFQIALDDDATSAQVKKRKEILLRLLDDGTFCQCNDEERSSRDSKKDWNGIWDISNEGELRLALQQTPGTVCAGLLVQSGDMTDGNDDSALQVSHGTISRGKFMYPRHHSYFWDQPLVASKTAGTFEASQVVRFAKLLVEKATAEAKPRQFTRTDFYDTQFFLAVTPIESKHSSEMDRPVDIRTMRVQFHTNHTFQMFGTNKILRGRYEVNFDDEEKEVLSLTVSRFGAGKNAPGSVYSEGPGLSHEDERTYVGRIQRIPSEGSSTSPSFVLLVQGSVMFGTDLGCDARPEPVGTFLMRQANDTSLEMTDERDDAAEDGLFDSVFE